MEEVAAGPDAALAPHVELGRHVVQQAQPFANVVQRDAVARVAGISAAKRTAELLPLAHVIGVHGVTVDLEITDDGVEIVATVRTADRTGVEMEALTAVSVAALAVLDMVKGMDKGTSITDVRLVAKSGGRSGDWSRP